MIILSEDPLRRLLREYVDYYNTDRVHTQLQDSPIGRSTENRPSSPRPVPPVAQPELEPLSEAYQQLQLRAHRTPSGQDSRVRATALVANPKR